MKIKIEKKAFPLSQPFAITGYTFTASDTVHVTLEEDGYTGRGEGAGVYYCGESGDTMAAQLAEIAGEVKSGLTRADVKALLPTGGARNALDSALWDLEAKRAGKTIWELLKVTPKKLISVATLGIDTPAKMAAAAQKYAQYPNLKIKLSGDDPITKLEAIRAARPDAALIVDVNQGWTFDELKEYTPAAQKLGIAMIEQPLKRGGDAELEGFKSAVPLGADESCLNVAEYEVAAKRYDVVNIKLDKCGGLTEGLEIVQLAQRDGKGLMIGNMTGSSLSMAPAYVIGQYCQFVDIDGPLFLAQDIENNLTYGDGGIVTIPTPALWG
ncbi:dipeptide epimerase [Kordiimonas pumila]|uniref:Dipeptide epimerase n=1 Tax=Kordiimonas pumila TaxID=2161677 RepID=A0ABV7D3V5_9PROT|nr:dipeptide epimerase [Kordiimonas pumila]